MSKQYSSYTVEEANKKVPVVVDSEDLSVHAKVGRSSKLKWSGVLWGFLLTLLHLSLRYVILLYSFTTFVI